MLLLRTFHGSYKNIQKLIGSTWHLLYTLGEGFGKYEKLMQTGLWQSPIASPHIEEILITNFWKIVADNLARQFIKNENLPFINHLLGIVLEVSHWHFEYSWEDRQNSVINNYKLWKITRMKNNGAKVMVSYLHGRGQETSFWKGLIWQMRRNQPHSGQKGKHFR